MAVKLYISPHPLPFTCWGKILIGALNTNFFMRKSFFGSDQPSQLHSLTTGLKFLIQKREMLHSYSKVPKFSDTRIFALFAQTYLSENLRSLPYCMQQKQKCRSDCIHAHCAFVVTYLIPDPLHIMYQRIYCLKWLTLTSQLWHYICKCIRM